MINWQAKIGTIPAEWEAINAKNYLLLESGQRPAEFVTDNPNDIPSLGGENITLDGFIDLSNLRYIDRSYFLRMKKGIIKHSDILINKDGANTGKIALVNGLPFENAAVNEHLFIIRTDGIFDQRFLFYFLFSDKGNRQIRAKITGSAQGGINTSVFKGVFIPKPPLPEQRKIASILTKVDDAIQAVKNTIEKAERLKKSLMQNLLTGNLKPDGTWRTDDEFNDIDKYGWVPIDWDYGRLGDIAEIIAGQSPIGDSYNENRAGIPMLNGPTEFTDRYPIPVQWTTKPTKLCKVGDILFTVRGSSTGRMNIADQEYCIGRGIAAIREIEDKSNIDYIYYLLIIIANKILAEAKGAGSTFPNVNRTELLKKRIIYPNENTQKLIAEKINSVDKTIISKQQKIQKLERLKKALMQNLLTGKVRVKV